MRKSLASIPYLVHKSRCTIVVYAWGSYTPGVSIGPMEDCYPPDGVPHEYQLLLNDVGVIQYDDDLIQEAIDEYIGALRDIPAPW